MTTYQKGREPAGAPVTYKPFPDGTAAFFRGEELWFTAKQWRPDQTFDAICAAFHAAAEWRKLAEEAREIERSKYGDGVGLHLSMLRWAGNFDAMKETFGD